MKPKTRSPRIDAPLRIRAAKPAATKPPAPKPATAPRELNLTAAAVEIAAEAQPAAGQKAAPRRFSLNAYNGGAMDLAGFHYPVVVDLNGVQGADKPRPIFRHHDPEQLVGHADQITITNSGIQASGAISGASDAAREVTAAHDQGFPWQASIGARVLNLEFVKGGSAAVVNGRSFQGPLNVARKTLLGEISFVPLGADDSTSARIAAAKAAKGSPMNFEQWLEAKGIAAAELSDPVRVVLKAQFDAEQAPPKDPPAGDPGAATAGPAPNANANANAAADPTKELRAAAAAESKRVGVIRRLCAGAGDPTTTLTADGRTETVSIEAHAIGEGWDENRTELEILRARRPAAANINTGAGVNAAPGRDVLEAAVCLAGGLDNLDKRFAAPTLEAAGKRFRHGIGLQELLLEAAAANGYTGRTVKGDVRGVLQAAFDVRAAGFSTFSLPGILSNTANKFLLQGFMYVEQVWRKIAARRSVSDFKAITSYRLNGNFIFDKVAADGEIKHGSVGEESYTNRAETYAKMFAITRQDIINDDLGALTAVPQRLGRGSALKFNLIFWAAFLNDAAFFTSGNKNYLVGASSNLQASSVQAGVAKFMRQTDADGNPVAAAPKYLLVPPELMDVADALYRSPSFLVGGGSTSTQVPTVNVYAGRYETISSVYLANTLAWYLLADPNDVPVIEVAFLNGNEQPTVETADADFNTLGVQMRGYFDFGVALQDPRGAIKTKGAA